MLNLAMVSRAAFYSMSLLALLMLAGCRNKLSIDLAVDAPARNEVAQVIVNVTGLEFRKADGTTATLEFDSSEPVTLTNYLDGESLRLLTDEELPEGTYTGVRLMLDPEEDASVIETAGGQFTAAVAAGDYTTIDYAVDDDENSSEALTLTLDLRQSLSFNDDGDEYTLTPVLRSVPTGDAGEIAGSIDVACPTGGSLAQGGAVYLFTGGDATVDDIDSDTRPYATTRIITNSVSEPASYTLRSIPEGDYTLVLTCRGDEEDPATDDDLNFQNTRNVQIDRGEALIENIS